MYVRVEATPDAKKEKIEETKPGWFRVFVREPAQQNLANRRIQALLAEWYTVPKGSIRLITGHRSPRKVYDVDLPS